MLKNSLLKSSNFQDSLNHNPCSQSKHASIQGRPHGLVTLIVGTLPRWENHRTSVQISQCFTTTVFQRTGITWCAHFLWCCSTQWMKNWWRQVFIGQKNS